MRIIGGTARGRRLRAPRGAATRPTADRVRESLFNILGPGDERRVLDLFAGAGTLGLEALSRGAATCVFVDKAPAAMRVLRDNIRALGWDAQCKTMQVDVRAALRQLAARSARVDPFGWVFIDPPYATELAARTLEQLGSGELLSASALVVAEHDRRRPLAVTYGVLAQVDRRSYGDTTLSFYQRTNS